MKKFLGFIALVALVILPMKVNAATYGLDFTQTEEDEQGYFTVTLKGFQTDNPSGLTEFQTTMTLTNVELVGDVVGNGGWTAVVSGNTLVFTSQNPVTDAEFTLATLTFKKINSAEKCYVKFTCNDVEKTVAPKTKTVKNPKTGNVLPYAVIAVGVVLAAGVYYVTRKNTKLYRI